MYHEFYGFEQEPFRLTPDPQFFYLGDNHNKALAHLLYGINNRKGFIALTGEVGAGKTTLCRLLLKQMDDENTSIAIILNSLVDELTFLKQINRDFSIPYETDSHDDLTGYLYDFLISEKKKGHNVIIIVDECQNLKFEVLEQIRMLSNLETEKDKLLQILLIGQPEFLDMLQSYELRQLEQRITVKAHISALSSKEMENYIYHRLKIAGNQNAVKFTKSALRKIYNFSKGIPRKINVVCDYALLAGYVANTRKINASLVKKALADILVKREGDSAREQKRRRAIISFRQSLIAATLIMLIYYYSDLIQSGFASLTEIFNHSNQNQKFLKIKMPEVKNFFNPAMENQKRSEIQAQNNVIDSDVSSSSDSIKEKELSNQNQKELSSASKTTEIPLEKVSESKADITSSKNDDSGNTSLKRTLPFEGISKVKENPDSGNSLNDQNDFGGKELYSSQNAIQYFQSLSSKEKGIWLLLSSWGMEISHHRKNSSGKNLSLEEQLDRFHFSLFMTWADLSLIKAINISCAVEVNKDNKNLFWILNGSKKNFLRFYISPEEMIVLKEDEFLEIWQGNAMVLVEKGENTLEGNEAIYRGMKGPKISKLKKLLQKTSFYNNSDMYPVFDLSLEKSVKEFQKMMHLTPDGIVGVEAKLLLYSKLSRNIPRLISSRNKR